MEKLPSPIEKYLEYLDVTQNRSARTIEQYRIDLTIFAKYLKATRNGIPLEGEEMAGLTVDDEDIAFFESVTSHEVVGFLGYVKNERENSARTRARKLSSVRGFYKYHNVAARDMENNPAKNIDTPRLSRTLPKHLEVEESVDLLECISADEESRSRERDYAIVTLFLNCGMRLSELVNINLNDINPQLEKLTVMGKGAKQRTIYLNDACRSALRSYLDVRAARGEPKANHKNALFLSSRGQRISQKTVQWMVYKYLRMAGLEYKHMSVHKLRHTAATLMYQSGEVDIRVLKDILGHEQLNTTQIYTHIENTELKIASEANPLSKLDFLDDN